MENYKIQCIPLSNEEKKWLNKLEKVFNQCPSDRLRCYTTGDSLLNFYDKQHLDVWKDLNRSFKLVDDDASIEHYNSGSALGYIKTKIVIDSCQ